MAKTSQKKCPGISDLVSEVNLAQRHIRAVPLVEVAAEYMEIPLKYLQEFLKSPGCELKYHWNPVLERNEIFDNDLAAWMDSRQGRDYRKLWSQRLRAESVEKAKQKIEDRAVARAPQGISMSWYEYNIWDR